MFNILFDIFSWGFSLAWCFFILFLLISVLDMLLNVNSIIYVITYPFKYAIFWCITKFNTYEIIVLITKRGTKILAISKIGKNSLQECKFRFWIFNIGYVKYHYYLGTDGIVYEDSEQKVSGGFITNWLPKSNKQKRLFMILSGARPFIT